MREGLRDEAAIDGEAVFACVECGGGLEVAHLRFQRLADCDVRGIRDDAVEACVLKACKEIRGDEPEMIRAQGARVLARHGECGDGDICCRHGCVQQLQRQGDGEDAGAGPDV